MNENEKKYNCDVIQDLLPLYQDDVCSSSSRTIVEEHLKECQNCRTVADRLRDNRLENRLEQEKTGILSTHAKKERKKTFVVGIVTAGVLMIPVLVCLICNLAIGHALDWFFIVLTSLLIVASLTVVPLVVPKKAGLWTILSATASLILLFLSTCIYSRGNWFFLTTIPTILGLSVFLMPYVVYQLPLPDALSRNKGVLVMLWDTIWLYATIIICGVHSSDPGYWDIALPVTTITILFPWAVFLIIRYTSIHWLSKTGCIFWLIGLFTAFANDILTFWIFGETDMRISHFDFLTWGAGLKTEDYWQVWNANITLIVLIVSLILGAALFGTGYYLKRHRNTAD